MENKYEGTGYIIIGIILGALLTWSIMQAGINLALKNMVDDNIDKLSWWKRFKHAWRYSLTKNKRS